MVFLIVPIDGIAEWVSGKDTADSTEKLRVQMPFLAVTFSPLSLVWGCGLSIYPSNEM